jgi:hypothetical protein
MLNQPMSSPQMIRILGFFPAMISFLSAMVTSPAIEIAGRARIREQMDVRQYRLVLGLAALDIPDPANKPLARILTKTQGRYWT